MVRLSQKRHRGPKTSRESIRTARVQIRQKKQVKASIRGQMIGAGMRPGWLVQLLMDQGMSRAKATAEANKRLKGQR